MTGTERTEITRQTEREQGTQSREEAGTRKLNAARKGTPQTCSRRSPPMLLILTTSERDMAMHLGRLSHIYHLSLREGHSFVKSH